MTTLVTGATGFVGAAVLRALAARGHRLRVLARPGSDRRNLKGIDCAVVDGNFGDPADAGRAVAGCEAIFHVAADYRMWVPDPDEMMRANVDGTRVLMEAALAAGVARVVYTSSVAALGLRADGLPSTEAAGAALADMIGPYKRSKFLAEAVVREMVERRGLPAVIVLPSAPIGPRDVRPTPTGRMIIDAARGRMPAYVDTGLNVVHVDDAAEGHCLAFERGVIGERYILGGDDMALRDILAEVARCRGRRPPRIRLPHGALLPVAVAAQAWARMFGGTPIATVDEVRMARKRMYFSSAKAESALGYRHRPAAAAIRDAIDWFAANGYLG